MKMHRIDLNKALRSATAVKTPFLRATSETSCGAPSQAANGVHARAVAESKAVAKHRAVVAELEASKQGSRRGSADSDLGRPVAASNSKPVSTVCVSTTSCM